MKRRIQRVGALFVAASVGFAAGPSRAIIDQELPTMPPGGWGYEGGNSIGMGAIAADIELPRVTVTGKRDDDATIYFINVPFTGILPVPAISDGGGGGPPDPQQQQTCITNCDTKQKIGKDLCDIAAAKASAANTTTAIGIGYAAGGLLAWRGGLLLGAAGGFAAYQLTQSLAKDHAATMNLACIAQAAQDHINCIKGVCKFQG